MNKIKRILALLLALFLAGLYITTLVISFLDAPQKEAMLQACIFSTVVIPIFLWTYALVYRLLKDKNQKDASSDTSSCSSISDIAHCQTQDKADESKR